MKAIIFACAIGILGAASPNAWGGEDDQDMAFELSNLETGRMVTLPRPATTFVDLGQSVRLSATDMPQNVVMTLVTPAGQKAAVTVTIYDPYSDRSKAMTLKPGTPALYPFKALSSIRVVPQRIVASTAGVRLKIESNKPLGIGR